MKRSKWQRLRNWTCALVVIFVIIGLLFHTGTGSLDSFGFGVIAAVCPLGQLETLVIGHNFTLHAVILLAVMLVIIALFGRAFCAWLCPSPHITDFFRGFKGKKKRSGKDNTAPAEDGSLAGDDSTSGDLGGNSLAGDSLVGAGLAGDSETLADKNKPLSESEKALLSKSGCGGCTTSCQLPAVGGTRDGLQIDSRHFTLVGALLCASIFGFPVFCLICPVGLSIAAIIAIWNMFRFAEVSIGVVLFPAILIVELVVCRKWCKSFCPLAALMSLLSQTKLTLRPRVDNKKCLRSQGVDCKQCVNICPEQVDPHSKNVAECTKCGACVEGCPAQAISIGFFSKKMSNTMSDTMSNTMGNTMSDTMSNTDTNAPSEFIETSAECAQKTDTPHQ